MLLMIEKWIRGRLCHFINRYPKANNKCMKDYDKTKESSYLKYWNINNLYGCKMSQKLPVNRFKWFEDLSQFIEDFIKCYNKKVMKDIFVKLIFNILKIYMNFIMI